MDTNKHEYPYRETLPEPSMNFRKIAFISVKLLILEIAEGHQNSNLNVSSINMKNIAYQFFVKLLLSLNILILTSELSASDWPQWRGPDRDGSWNETGLISEFDSPTLKAQWSAPVGAGYSGPTVSDGRVYLTSRIEESDEVEQIHCVDEKTGKEIWKYVYPCVYIELGYPLGPRAAVTISEGKAYALGAMGHFHCLDAATGDVIWKRDLAVDYKVGKLIWGIAASPLVDKQNVYLIVGGEPDAAVVALNKDNGKEVWRSLDGMGSYSSPRFIEQAGKRLLLVWSGDWFATLEPNTGKPAWKLPFERAKMVINASDPVVDNETNRIFFSSFYDGSYLIQLDSKSTDAEMVWSRRGRSEIHTDALQGIITTAFIRENHVYGLDSYGELRCLDMETGDRVWSDQSLLNKGRWATAFFVQNGDKTWIFTELGELVIARLSPDGFERISATQIIEPTTHLPRRNTKILWSHPAYANKHIFARNDRELISVNLSN